MDKGFATGIMTCILFCFLLTSVLFILTYCAEKEKEEQKIIDSVVSEQRAKIVEEQKPNCEEKDEAISAESNTAVQEESINALVALGIKKTEAKKMVLSIIRKDKNLSSQEVIKLVLSSRKN